MAIVNLTEDSFSGDGVGDDIDAAVRRAVEAVSAGADVIDLGAESARADVPVRAADEEAQLLGEAVRRVAAEVGATISADTYKPAVARAALEAGAHMINDIGGLIAGPDVAEAAAAYGAALVINYTRELPKVRPAAPPRYEDLIGEHVAFLRSRIALAEASGVAPDRTVIDPGIAFGKSHDEDLEVLRRLDEFRAIGRPLMVAASRKHFIGSVSGVAVGERDAAGAAVAALAIAGGADIVRVHDVRTTLQAVRVADAIVRGHAGDYAATPQSWPWAAGAEPLPGTRIGETQPPGGSEP
jgi:dihydropteroate synthase